MKEIECPKCGTTFQVDDSTYESIVAQVRSKVFNEELAKRLEEAEARFNAREKTVRLETEQSFEKRLNESNDRIASLNNEITRLSGVIDNYEAKKDSEIASLQAKKDSEIASLQAKKDSEIASLRAKKEKEMFDALSEKDSLIAKLNAEIAGKDSEHRALILEEKNAGKSAVMEKQQEITELQAELKSDRLLAEKRESELRELHKQQLQIKQDEIDRLKEYKMRLSTKMVGETLEQHCSIQFARAQSLGMYPTASFTKDNIAVEHSKGDFIFRDYVDSEEYVSVMFEMKNEMDTTASKHKNEDFLEKLDKDRQRKGCEYAVLVSMLEQGNELYDEGIVDMSHRYPKMIVIRPQFFLPVLRLISEAARKGHMERRALVMELEEARTQSRDFTKFEERLNRFRTTFSNNVAAAHKKFIAATEGIDKTIEALEKQIKALRDIKANFEASEQKLLKANELAEEDLTVKKLTYGAPSVRKKIEEIKIKN